MSEYTAEDFAKANLATRGEYMVARRCGEGRVPWVIPLHNRPSLHVSDANMVLHGWVPVVEIEDWKQRIDDLRATHDDVKSSLKDTADDLRARVDEREATIRDLRHDLALAREALVDLRWENRQLEAGAEGVVSLDGLKVAWETAEQATEEAPIREGDVVIVRHGGGFTVEPADRILSGQTHGRERILSRAPKPELPEWQALADVLADMGHLSPTGHAKALYERGVRVTGGDEK